MTAKKLIKFGHGLGDAVQFTIILKHLHKYFPNIWEVSSRHQDLFGLPSFQEQEYSEVKKLLFSPGTYYPNLPSTKVTRCLLRELGIAPDLSLYSYECPIFQSNIADQFLSDTHRYVLVHPEGVSSPKRKNMTRDEILYLVEQVRARNLEPILLDFKCSFSDIECRRTAIPYSIPTLSVLLRRAEMLIGIDSGPEHLALACGCPTIIVWKDWFPLHNIEPSPLLTNWVLMKSFRHFNPYQEDLRDHLDYFWHNYNVAIYRTIQDVQIGKNTD